MLGAGVWVFAALKGYSGFDDPHPEYGKMHRTQQSAAADLAELRAEFREELEDAVEDAHAAIEEELESMREAIRSMRLEYDEAATALGGLDTRLRKIDDLAGSLVQLYRRENLATRTTSPPSYFSEPAPIPSPPEDALAGSGRELSDAQERLSAAQSGASEALRALAGDMEAVSSRLNGRAEP
jgi:hypothetical protein